MSREEKGTVTFSCYQRGRFATTVNGRSAVVEYEPDTGLRDTEQVPLMEEGGMTGSWIARFFAVPTTHRISRKK